MPPEAEDANERCALHSATDCLRAALPVGQRKTGADLKPVLTMADATANLQAGAFVGIWLGTAKL